jgi:WD40 repeat protein
MKQAGPVLLLVCLTFVALLSRPVTSEHLSSTASPSKITSSNAAKDDTVLAELIGLQVRDGLTIASYGPRGLGIVDFKKRKALLGKPFPNHRGFQGTVGNDGVQVAFALRSLSLSSPLTLGVMKTDNSDLREFPSVRNPGEMCWSNDMSRIAMGTVNTRNSALRLTVLNIATESVRELSSDIGRLTAQCWSPDGKEIVFESEGKVIVQNVEDGERKTLGVGRAPTWSGDGNWIAFFDEHDHNYYVVRRSGEGKKKLFHHGRAVAGLYWSPDSRIVAYVIEIGGLVSLESYKLEVRRLEDGSEDWVEDADLGCCESLQWITNRALLSQLRSEDSSE